VSRLAVIFQDDRLRIADVVRDHGMTEPAQAPEDSQREHAG
jgi:hypothetical protein